MLVSEFFEYLGSGLKVPTEINGFLLSIDASFYQKRKIKNLILCWFLCSVYAIMLVSEICEYLGSGLKVPTEINGFNTARYFFDIPLFVKSRTSFEMR